MAPLSQLTATSSCPPAACHGGGHAPGHMAGVCQLLPRLLKVSRPASGLLCRCWGIFLL